MVTKNNHFRGKKKHSFYFKQENLNRLLDLSKIKDGTKKRLVFANLGTTENQKEEQECEGVIILDKNRKKIRCKLFSYDLPIERCELNEFYEDEEVIFVVNSRPQDKNPSKPYYFATNLRPKED